MKRRFVVCRVCGERIPAGRLKVIPDADTCTKHSETERLTDRDVPTALSDEGDAKGSVSGSED